MKKIPTAAAAVYKVKWHIRDQMTHNAHNDLHALMSLSEWGWGGLESFPSPRLNIFCPLKYFSPTRLNYTGAPIVGIARWSVPGVGQGHLEVEW